MGELFGIDCVPTLEQIAKGEPVPLTPGSLAEPPAVKSEPVRWVTCVSCGQTFAAREYPPRQCTACGIHFSSKVLTKVGDTLEAVQKREKRKQLRKGKRK